MVLVDTSVWIESGRPKGRVEVKAALESLLDAYEAAWCGVVKIEFLGYVKASERRKLEFFFSTIPYRSIGEPQWEAAKKLGWRLRDSGLTVPANDILLAAVAIEAGCRLYSVDGHFAEIAACVPALRLYQPGYGGSYDPGQE